MSGRVGVSAGRGARGLERERGTSLIHCSGGAVVVSSSGLRGCRQGELAASVGIRSVGSARAGRRGFEQRTRQVSPRTVREVVQRARARIVAPGEPAQYTAPLTRRARVLPATARSSRRRRYAIIHVHVHPCCIDTRRWCRK